MKRHAAAMQAETLRLQQLCQAMQAESIVRSWRLFLGEADLLQRLSALDVDTVVLALDFLLSSVVFLALLVPSVVFSHISHVVLARFLRFHPVPLY
jgi:hypothetical protein